MPVSWEVFAAYVEFESDGVATLNELEGAFRGAVLDPSWHRRLNVIDDQRQILRTFHSFELTQRVAFVRDRSKEFGILRWAVVVKGDAHFGMARMGQGWLEQVSAVKFAVFKDLEDARAWASITWDREK